VTGRTWSGAPTRRSRSNGRFSKNLTAGGASRGPGIGLGSRPGHLESESPE
jgi:hypothetical protein